MNKQGWFLCNIELGKMEKKVPVFEGHCKASVSRNNLLMQMPCKNESYTKDLLYICLC